MGPETQRLITLRQGLVLFHLIVQRERRVSCSCNQLQTLNVCVHGLRVREFRPIEWMPFTHSLQQIKERERTDANEILCLI